jgi:molecular chaperone GrpE
MEQKNKKETDNTKDIKKLEKKVGELALIIDKVEDEKLQVENQLKKALADYHNLVKNSEKRDQLRFFQVKKNLSEEIIPTLDSIMMAKETSKDMKFDEKNKAWFRGVLAILESINKNFEDIGLVKYVPQKGELFNNEMHEAVAMVQEGEKGKIYDVIQPGYTLDETVIRPARVVVSK